MVLSYETAEIEHCAGVTKGLKDRCHLGRAEHIGGVVPFAKGGSKKRVIAMAVGKEDMLGPDFVDTQACVEEQVELRDHKRGVPCGARATGQDIVMIRFRKTPLQDLGACGLRERISEGDCGCHAEGERWQLNPVASGVCERWQVIIPCSSLLRSLIVDEALCGCRG